MLTVRGITGKIILFPSVLLNRNQKAKFNLTVNDDLVLAHFYVQRMSAQGSNTRHSQVSTLVLVVETVTSLEKQKWRCRVDEWVSH